MALAINLAQESQRIARELPSFEIRLKSREAHYGALQHLVGIRPGFERRVENAQAQTPGGLYDGYVSEDINRTTGFTERVSYSGNKFLRVLYDEKNVPVAAYRLNVTPEGHLDAYVLAPGEEGEIMQVKPDGSKTLFQSPGNFLDSFSKKWFKLIEK